MSKITIKLGFDRIWLRFPVSINGLKEWATDELKAAWVADFSSVDKSAAKLQEWRGWWYVLPATKENAALLVISAPLPLEADSEFSSKFKTVGSDFDLMKSAADELAENLEQPAVRMFDQWRHQLRGYHFAKRHNYRAALGMGMGTGKSKVFIDIAQNEPVKTCLILCPPSVLGVWRGQFRQHGPQANVLILDDRYSSVLAKRKAAERFYEAATRRDNRRLFTIVINYESARLKDFSEWAVRAGWDLVGLDESHKCKDATGTTGKFINRLRPVSTRRICLSGTLMPHSPADIFSQFRFVDPSVFGDSFFTFKKRYAITGFFNEVIGWRHKLELRNKVHSRAIIIGSEVLDLPEAVHSEREFDLPEDAQKVYRDLWEEFISETSAGIVTVDNALVKLVRAQQITSGFVPLDLAPDYDSPEPAKTKQTIEVLHDFKANALEELIEDLPDGEPVVVFCRWKYDLDRIREVTERLEWRRNECKPGDEKKRQQLIDSGEWRPFRYGEVSGRQKDLTTESKLSPDCEVFGVQVQSGGVGVDFTRAAIAVLYSIDFSLGNYDQMLARLVRPGQKRSVRFFHLIARRTVDRRIYQALQQRRNVVESILGGGAGALAADLEGGDDA